MSNFEDDIVFDNRERTNESSKFHDNYTLDSLKDLLLESPSIINMQDEKSGWTLLYNSVVNNHFDMLEYLLKSGADPNIPNIYGESPLYQAVDIGNHRVINLLLEQGADPNLQQQVSLFLIPGWRYALAHCFD